jgi:hypothetical protein
VAAPRRIIHGKRRRADILSPRRHADSTAALASPGWTSTLLDPGDLRVGDFATVTTRRQDGSRAVALQVIRSSA